MCQNPKINSSRFSVSPTARILLTQRFRSVGFAVGFLICLASVISAQEITIDYHKIVDTTPLTHSGMDIDGVIKYIKKAQATQITAAQVAALRQDVTKWQQEVRARRQKAESTRARLNEMLAAGTISFQDAKKRYDDWVSYESEAQTELVRAQALLNVSSEQNQAIQNLQAQIEPFLEPYAFLLEDALETDALDKRKDLIDLADLFPEGAPQPAWADLVRSRRYMVLSDGKGYARIFAPGATGASAYEQNYGVLRHILGWLWDSTKTVWTFDVYGYQNDLTSQVLKLNTTPHIVKVNSVPAPPVNSIPLDLQGMKEFLEKKLTVEGAYLNDEGTLVLYGSKASTVPTLEGQPIELSDLAVAYRAVAYAGHGDAYISLDRSPYPEQVNVNFGGRLADTRIGWVVLRSDMRFKTLSDGFDPVTGESQTATIRKVISDFKTQAERQLEAPKSKVDEEYTRYWFSPDQERLIVAASRDRKLMKISSPRFTGNAVREDPALGNIVRTNYQTPAWTRDTLGNLNRNYDSFANVFSELRELDDVGRLLALFTWLNQQKTRLDLDALLNVELPRAQTPRRKPQLLVGYSLENGQLVQRNVSQIAGEWENRRPRGKTSVGVGGSLPKTEVDVQAEIYSALTPDLSSVEFRIKVLTGQIRQFAVIAGGIDLNLGKLVAKPRPIPPAELAVIQRLKQSPVGEIKISPRRTIIRAQSKTLVEIAQPKLSGVAHTIGDASPNPRIGPTAKTRVVVGTKEEITTVATAGDKLKWSRRGTNDSLSEGNSRLVYYGENNAPTAFVRYEKGSELSYSLSARNGVVTAEKATPPNAIDDVAAINQSLNRGESASQTWKRLPEGTNVVAFEKLPNHETVILRSEANTFQFTRYNERGAVLESLKGDAAVARVNKISRQIVETASTDNSKFIHGSTEGDKFVLTVGGKTKEMPITELQELMKNPSRTERYAIDELFDVPPGAKRDFVIYRDALTRRPTRFGGSVTEGTVSDPVQLLSLVRQRYRGTRIYLDDETDVAKQNLASMQPIRRPEDVGLLIPAETFEIRDFDLIRRVKSNMAASGVVLIDSFQQLKPLPNVLVVAGHNDSRLVNLLNNLGEQGLLKDKVLLLNTCYDKGNSNLFHDLIQKYQPKAVFLHTDKISDVALDPVLKNLGQMLREMEQKGEAIHPADLFEKAVDRTLENPSLSDRQRLEINKLRKSSLQISYVKPVNIPERPAG